MSLILKRTGGRALAAGVLIFVVSFFFVAVGPYPMPGYTGTVFEETGTVF